MGQAGGFGRINNTPTGPSPKADGKIPVPLGGIGAHQKVAACCYQGCGDCCKYIVLHSIIPYQSTSTVISCTEAPGDAKDPEDSEVTGAGPLSIPAGVGEINSSRALSAVPATLPVSGSVLAKCPAPT
jgi:hypothetical protein